MVIDILDKAKLAVKLAEDKKCENPIILHISKVSNLCDYFVILSAESSRRVETIAEAIKDGFEKKSIKILHYEGKDTCLWVLLDTGDVIVHVFRSDMREFYALERLWSSAEVIKL
ncbi:MAG: ribosome silencing factor [Candidatus Omnitrophota bacterium]